MITAPQLTRILSAARSHSLNGSALALLTLLHEHGDLTMSEAARLLSLSGPNLTDCADLLEKSKLAVRQHSRSDRRKINLGITPLGCTVIERVFSGIPAPKAMPAPTLGLRLTR